MDVKTLVGEASTNDLKALIGAIMTELRVRKAAERGVTPVAPAVKAAERAAAKEAYHAHKAEVASRPFGVKRASDGKILKRRFNDIGQAHAAAAELTVSMKTVYEATAI